MNERELAEWQQMLAESRAREAEKARERKGYPHQFKVGDGATVHLYTDASAWTVIAVSPSGRTITIQGDNAELSPDWKPEIIPGGFSGHCVNNYSQEWVCTPNPNGPVRKARLTKSGWSANGNRVSKGRRPFHDYNF